MASVNQKRRFYQYTWTYHDIANSIIYQNLFKGNNISQIDILLWPLYYGINQINLFGSNAKYVLKII
ncbi:MAG: hypothetical protein HOD92_00345 [Deltaproteobacteria bacterium]|nr:hypothetical protein [Deltaproteobacteria bacterium]